MANIQVEHDNSFQNAHLIISQFLLLIAHIMNISLKVYWFICKNKIEGAVFGDKIE